MDIKWVGSPNHTPGREGITIDRVVLHWIVGKLESADTVFQNTTRNTSSHYGIGDDEIHQYVKETDTAYHAGVWAMNLRSIGIEHEGGPDLPVSDLTYQTSAKLVAEVCNRYQIPLDREHIIKHNEVRATQCPGTLDIDRIITNAKKALQTPEPLGDQLKVNLGAELGVMEVQAIRSVILDSQKKIAELEPKAHQMDGLIAKWVQEFNLPVGSNLVEIETEMAKLLPLEDQLQVFRNAIEELTGHFDNDSALLTALQAAKQDKQTLSDQLAKCQQNLSTKKILGSFKLFGLIFKYYKDGE